MKFVVGITGASGSIYGLRLIEVLKNMGHEVHLVVTESGWQVLYHECNVSEDSLRQKVDYIYNNTDIGAAIASGSFKTNAMIIAPCSMKTTACIANGISDNLLTRAADVIIKESKTLIIVPREAPLSAIHLENLLKLSRLGVKVVPACPAFYYKPQSISDMIDMIIGKVCDVAGLECDLYKRWQGIGNEK